MIKKLKKIFEDTIRDNYEYKGSLRYISCSDLITKATNEYRNFKYGINNLCMMKYRFYNKDAVLMIFAIPIKTSEDIRNVNERFFDVLIDIEQAFITLDYRQLEESKEEEYIYFICVKIIDNEEDN